MPKKAIEIRHFNKGMVTNVDITDLPIDTPSYTKGLETHNSIGSLSGSSIDEDIINGLAIETGIGFVLDNTNVMFAVSTAGNMYFVYGLYDTPYYRTFDKHSKHDAIPQDPGMVE